MNNKNWVQSVNQPNKKSKANETNVQANAQCYFDFIECQREIGARCIAQWVRYFKMFSIWCCCCIFLHVYMFWTELSSSCFLQCETNEISQQFVLFVSVILHRIFQRIAAFNCNAHIILLLKTVAVFGCCCYFA